MGADDNRVALREYIERIMDERTQSTERALQLQAEVTRAHSAAQDEKIEALKTLVADLRESRANWQGQAAIVSVLAGGGVAIVVGLVLRFVIK